MWKSTKALSEENWSLGRDLNKGPPEYKTHALTSPPRRSVFYCNKYHLYKCNVYGLSPWNKILILTFNRPPRSYICLSQKWSNWKAFFLRRSKRIENFMLQHLLVQILHPPKKFECPPFFNCGSHETEKWHGIEVTLNNIISLLNFIEVYQLVQKLKVLADTGTGLCCHKPHIPSYRKCAKSSIITSILKIICWM
jgi:hypothetical protein